MTLQTIDKNMDNLWNKSFSNEEKNKIRNNALYKGRLSYIKEIILTESPDITPTNISEKLDVPLSMAILLLEDCLKKGVMNQIKE